MTTIIVHPKDEQQLEAIKALLKTAEVSFEEENDDYDPEFVAMVLKGDEEIKAGKGSKVDVKNLWK
ncbi:DUF2683 family protein [Mucilaginibacter gilvus]|uniref:Uncharacterized protein n=1 Tax=Mucilaginibacter gilvus TaxID=2305909 RepID=A0A444MSH8_9SPHI|nr:DUF2683 family protein [Mucilaginibacter gilvus]RWY55579.1 hypothetical protein EPL05_04170 [Mucilaginibacter gilvus]